MPGRPTSSSIFARILGLLAGIIIVIQQLLLMGNITFSLGFAGDNNAHVVSLLDASSSDGASAASNLPNSDKSIATQAATTQTGTPPHYSGNPQTDAILFLFCPGGGNTTVRFVEQAVLSSVAAGFGKHQIVIIDTSPSTHCYHHSPFLQQHVGYVYPTIPSDLNFASLQNVAWNLARNWGYPYYFWQHADVILTHHGETEVFADKAIRIVHNITQSTKDWGIVHFAYDWFAAYRTEAVAKVRWDQGITHYFADCDFHIRIQFGGFKIIESYSGGVLHCKTLIEPLPPVESYSIDWYKERGAFETRLVKLNRLKHSTNPNARGMISPKAKLDYQGVKDISSRAMDMRYQTENNATKKYYEEKWGSLHCNWNPGGKLESIGPEFPRFDINDAIQPEKRRTGSTRRRSGMQMQTSGGKIIRNVLLQK